MMSLRMRNVGLIAGMMAMSAASGAQSDIPAPVAAPFDIPASARGNGTRARWRSKESGPTRAEKKRRRKLAHASRLKNR